MCVCILLSSSLSPDRQSVPPGRVLQPCSAQDKKPQIYAISVSKELLSRPVEE